MSAPAPTGMTGYGTTSRAGWRFAAVVVLVGLAALAGYAMFSGPTTLPSNAPTKVAPSTTAPPPAIPNEEQDREGGSD